MHLFPAVKAVIKKENKFLVIKQLVGEHVFWDLPGGKIDYGESPMQALHREIKEETNLEVEVIKPLGMWYFFRTDKNQVVCTTFLCYPKHDLVHSGNNSDAKENIGELKWVTKEEFLKPEYPVSHNSIKEFIATI